MSPCICLIFLCFVLEQISGFAASPLESKKRGQPSGCTGRFQLSGRLPRVNVIVDVLPVVPRKAVTAVSEKETYRRGWLL